MKANWGNSLRARIGVLLCAAALPAAAISIASAISLYGATVDLNNQALLDAAKAAARRVEDEISEGLKVAQLLAALPNTGPTRALCDEAFAIVIKSTAVISAAALVDPDGELACSAGIDVDAEQAILVAASAEVGQLIVRGGLGASSVAPAGRPDWRMAIAQPLLSPLKAVMDTNSAEPRVGVFDANWSAIAGSPIMQRAPAAGEAPRVPPSDVVGTVSIYSQDGVTYRRAVVPIARSSLYAAAFQPQPLLFAEETAVFLGGVAAPLLTIMFTITAAWIGIDRMALRWISYLRRLTDAYAAGRESVRAARLNDAPDELAALGAAFDRMAEAVSDRTAAAEAAAQARGLLLLELHHRINNNFQLIGSLINLQKRDASPDAAESLSAHERRVCAIATAYRISYRDGEVRPVGLQDLLKELASSIRALTGSPIRFKAEASQLLPAVVLDRAVPVALLVTELCAAQEPGPARDRRPKTVAARQVGAHVTISVSGLAAPIRRNGFDRRVRGLLAKQLGGCVEWAKDRSEARIVFPVESAPMGL